MPTSGMMRWRLLSLCIVTGHSETLEGCRRVRRIAAGGIEGHAVVRRVEHRVVEDIERLRVESQRNSFRQFRVFEGTEVKASLERDTEDIAPGGAVARFNVITQRYPHLAGRDQRNTECSGVQQHWPNSRTGAWAWGHFLRARPRLAGQKRNDGIPDKVIRPEVQAGHASGEIVNAVWLYALCHDDSPDAPSICNLVLESFRLSDFGNFVLIRQYVVAVEVGGSVSRVRLQGIVACNERS